MPFTRRAVLSGLSAAAYSRIAGANDRVGVGFIGFGLIGAQHVRDFRQDGGADMVALSDVYQPRLEQGVAACGGTARGYADFRKLLDDKDVQAVVVSTPDHWHALMTMLACAAGKDVYVEKPLTLFQREGRWMQTVATRHQRVVQVGTQQRSGKHYQSARELVQGGYIGKVHAVRTSTYRNVMPGFGRPPEGQPPLGLDYDAWLGPAPKRPYSPHRAIYHFRWFWDYSGGQMTNLAAHELDIAYWFLDLNGPRAVASSGGRFALEDDGETPDTQDALFEFPNLNVAWSHREASGGRRAGMGLEFCGTKGSLVIGRGGFEVFPDQRIPPENAVPSFAGQPAGGPQRVAAEVKPWVEARKEAGSSDEQLRGHVRNFLDCVRTRSAPLAGLEQAHHVSTACHLANISLRTGRKLRWNTGREEITGDAESNAMLERPYRAPWDGVLRRLLA